MGGGRLCLGRLGGVCRELLEGEGARGDGEEAGCSLIGCEKCE
jgi:hypothetical protein